MIWETHYPKEPGFISSLAFACSRAFRNKFPRIANIFLRASTATDDNYHALIERARLAEQNRDFASAEQHFKNALSDKKDSKRKESTSSNFPVHVAYGNFLLRQNRLGDAWIQSDKALQWFSCAPEALILKAQIALAMDHKKDADVFANEAALFIFEANDNGDTKLCESILKKALEINPRCGYAHSRMALICYHNREHTDETTREKNYREAMQHVDAVLSLSDPEAPFHHEAMNTKRLIEADWKKEHPAYPTSRKPQPAP